MANYGTRYVKKKTPWLAFALMLIVFLILGYLISGVYVAPKELKGDYNAQLLWAFTHPIKAANSKSPAWVGIGFIAWFFFVNYYMIHYRNFHSEMEHGDEDWLDPVKASRELKDSDDKYNRILSENVKVSIRGKLSNNNMMIVGSSGSFKTTSIMHQNLLQMGSSYVVLDVKGDTQRKLGKIFEKNGYQIYSLNFKNPEQSDRYNPFEWIQTEADMLRKSYHKIHRKAKRAAAGTSIEHRPVDIDTREEFGHWEMDSVMGQQGKSKNALVVLTERKTRYEKIFKVKDHTAASVVKCINSLERKWGRLFSDIFKTITVDNGTEFADCEGIEKKDKKGKKRTEVYYCHPYCSSERGSNENQNRMIRRHIPKGTNFDRKTKKDIQKVEDWLNNYPRPMFGGRSSQELYEEEMRLII